MMGMPALQKKCLLEKVAMGPALEVDMEQMYTMIHYRELGRHISLLHCMCTHTLYPELQLWINCEHIGHFAIE